MGIINNKKILEALSAVQDGKRGGDIVSLGMVSGIQISPDGSVFFLIHVDPERGPHMEALRQEAEKAVEALRGAGKVSCVLTSESAEPDKRAKKSAPGKQPSLVGFAKHVIVVASGKGGVGKSTVASNIAVHLSKYSHYKDGEVLGPQSDASGRHLRVGLLDADIYGPSVPKMLGVEDYKPPLNAHKKLIPAQAHGIKLMSIGFMVDKERALIWRGPMVQSALLQMLRDVAWDEAHAGDRCVEPALDYLIIDLPPGTGDVQLTLAQKVPVTGAVVVSTPQDVALIDARRACEMFQKTKVPILGVVENMSMFSCPNCGHESDIFGHGGAAKEAENIEVPFLGAVPLVPDIRLTSDEGMPITLAQPGSPSAKAFARITKNIITATNC